ncbi:MarR family transcriptional regulator [Catenulispora subtropica]|uniref:HTH marR-type domain-containing protein n=1 Tax=Catenulispora subtropica TaxID=450798 RepID=A0ABP5BRT6_9ACTN
MPEFLDLHGNTNKAVRAVADAGMRRLGLHLGQNHVLALLWEQDGRPPGEIAAALHVSTPTVVKMATRMTAAGLLTRRRDERDNRLVRLWLTEAGRALRQPVEQERENLENRLTADLTEREREQLISALTKIRRRALELLADSDPADAEPR